MSSMSITCKTVGELRRLLRGVPDDVMLHVGEACAPRLTVHYLGDPGHASQIDIEQGDEHE